MVTDLARRASASSVIAPLARALRQWRDPVFLGVLLRSILWSAACFIALHIVAIWTIHRTFDLPGWASWAVDIAGSIGASLLALWLFLPVAAVIATLYIGRVADAVER